MISISSFTRSTLIEEAALGLRPEEKDCIYKAESILFGLGFKEEDLDRSPQEFSGGYQLETSSGKSSRWGTRLPASR